MARTAAVFAENQPQRVAREAALGIVSPFSHCQALRLVEDDTAAVLALLSRPDSVAMQRDLDLFSDTINGSRAMPDKPEIQAEQIFHETKFVFLSCARVTETSVVHTTVDVNIQEAWTHAPKKTKCETTHVVKCETEIYQVDTRKDYSSHE